MGEARSYADRMRVAAGGATHFGGGGPQDRPPENPGTEGFRLNISVPNIFCGAATRSACLTTPSLSQYPTIDKLPHTVCSRLSRRRTSYNGGPLTTQTTGGGYGWTQCDHTSVGKHTETSRGHKKLKLKLKLFTSCPGKLDQVSSHGPLYFAIHDLFASWARVSPTRFISYRHTYLQCVSRRSSGVI
jgi:hypothetical protein